MLSRATSSLQDCPLLPLYFLAGFLSRAQSHSISNNQAGDQSLAELFNKYNSDKASLHAYDSAYSLLFSGLRDDRLNMLEIGIGSNDTSIPFNMGNTGSIGASLFSWREYFPNAHIYGADIDPSCMFEATRIKTYICNQLSFASVRQMGSLATSADAGHKKRFFDICIDDGYHSFGANSRTYLALKPFLRTGHIYIIEDVSPWMEIAWKGFSLIHSLNVRIFKFPSSQQPLLMIVLTE